MTANNQPNPKSEDIRTCDLVVYAGVGVLLSGGAILGCSTLWNLSRLYYFFYTTDLGVELGSTVAFIAAALLSLPIAWTANMVCSYPKSSVVLGVLVFLVCAGLLVLSAGMSALLGLSQALRSPLLLNSSMHAAMELEAFSPSVRKAFNYMQLGLRCCGVDSPADWLHSERPLPPSCCNRYLNLEGEECLTPTFNTGCLAPALCELRSFVNGISFLATTNIVVLAMIIFSASFSVVDHLMSAVKMPSPGLPFFLLTNSASETQAN